jgi:hypothetical protein
MDEYADADIYYVDARNASRDHRRPGASSVPFRPTAPPPSRTVLVPHSPAPAQVVYAQPLPQQSAFGNLFGKLTPGQVIEMVAQLFAALQPLPAAPSPTRNGDTDSANMILFQDALAKHAKRDEQVRTIGSSLAKLVG